MHYQDDRTISDLISSLDRSALTRGQRQRIELFKLVEADICSRVEALCEQGEIDVTDLAVLVVGPTAPGEGSALSGVGMVNVVIGHRTRLYGLLHAVLPPSDEVTEDPYRDLLEPSPFRCTRVLVIHADALTMINYGCFAKVAFDPANLAVA
jgi:hypothetical protein